MLIYQCYNCFCCIFLTKLKVFWQHTITQKHTFKDEPPENDLVTSMKMWNWVDIQLLKGEICTFSVSQDVCVCVYACAFLCVLCIIWYIDQQGWDWTQRGGSGDILYDYTYICVFICVCLSTICLSSPLTSSSVSVSVSSAAVQIFIICVSSLRY